MKIVASCAALAAFLGLILGLSQVDQLVDPAFETSPGQTDYNVGYDVARRHLSQGDSRELALNKCKADARASPPNTDTRKFINGCSAGVMAWRDSDWPEGAPTHSD